MEHPAHTCCRGGDATAFFRAFAFFMGVEGSCLALPAVNVGGKVEQAGQSHILNQNFLIYYSVIDHV